MPFSEIELKYIESTIGGMCKRRSPEHLSNQIRTIFEIKGHDVIVYEERPGWDNPQQWSRSPVAKLKYVRKDNVWKLYWMKRDMKWHLYQMLDAAKRLELWSTKWTKIRTVHFLAEPAHNRRNEFKDDDLVCYCFKYTKRDIENDWGENGRSLIYRKIISERKSGGCNCAS